MGRQLRNSPLSEAVCEIRFRPGAPWDAGVPGLIAHELREQFPERRPAMRLDTSIEAGPDMFRQQVTPVDSLVLVNEAEGSRVVISPHTISVGYGASYPGWERFAATIRLALGAYGEVAQPAGYQRLGLRYINRIVLPG